jgi:hypothetical protein
MRPSIVGLSSTGRSWRLDETSIRVNGEWRYLYRAVDKYGQTIDFLLTEHRDKAAARRFLTQAIRRHGVPKTITMDGRDADETAIKSYHEEHGPHRIIRPVTEWHHMVEQDHRGVKRVTRPMRGCKSFAAAQDTVAGIDLMPIRKGGQMMVTAAAEGLTAAEQVYALAASSPSRTECAHLTSSPHENLRQSRRDTSEAPGQLQIIRSCGDGLQSGPGNCRLSRM